MRITAIILLSLLCSVNSVAQSKKNVIDEVIWVVGDEAIYKSDVENVRQEYKLNNMPIQGDPYCVIPEQLAVQKLFLHQAEIDSIEVTDAEVFEEVDAKIEDYIENGFGSRERMESLWNKSMSQIRDMLFDGQKVALTVRKVQQEMMKNVKVTPAQVRNFYKGVSQDSLPYIPTKVEVQLFVREPEITQEEIDRVKDELRGYTERVNSGKDKFSTLAVMYCEDGSAMNGGELGFKGRGQLVPEFANVAFNLTDPKAISKIVETEYGFHIIQLIEKRGDKVNVRHILRKPKVSDEAIEKCIHFLDSVCDEIRRGDYAFEDPLPYLSQDKDTKNNYGNFVYRDPMTYESSTKIEMKNLPTEVAKAVSGMNIGEISKPFIMRNNQGKEVVAVVKLKNKINGHRANISDDYQVLQSAMLDKLRSDKLDKWIKEKQKTIYVRINEDWRNCEFEYPGWIKE